MIRGTLAAFAVALFLAAPASAAQPYDVSYHVFALPRTGVTFDNAPGGVWTSPWFQTGFGFTELVSSWNADTPAGTWIKIDMRATTDRGTTTKWYTMGRWAFGDGDIQRTSVGGQGDADGFVSIDTFFAKDIISYDPASASDATVRHVYNRAQFERAWMSATGGIVYVIHPASVPLPPSSGNW